MDISTKIISARGLGLLLSFLLVPMPAMAVPAVASTSAPGPVAPGPVVAAPAVWHVNFIRYGNPTNWLGTLHIDASGHGSMAIKVPVVYTSGCDASGLGITSKVPQGAEVVAAPMAGGAEKITVYLIYLDHMPLIKAGACLFERPSVSRATATFLVDTSQTGTRSVPLRGGYSLNLTPAG